MQVQLKVANGSKAGMVIAINKPRFLIGRAEDCQLKPKSSLISRYHCAILSEDGYVAARDLGSKNGVFLNGDRIQVEEELKNGDHLVIGPLEFEVVLSVTLAAEKKMPKVESIAEVVARTVARDKMVPAQPEGKGGSEDAAEWLLDEEDADSSMGTQTIPAQSLKELGLAEEPAEEPAPKPAAVKPAAKPEPAKPAAVQKSDSAKPETEKMTAVPAQAAPPENEDVYGIDESIFESDDGGSTADDDELARLLDLGDSSTVDSSAAETIVAAPKSAAAKPAPVKPAPAKPVPQPAAAEGSPDADSAANMLKNFFQGH